MNDQANNLAQNLEKTKELPTYPSPTIIEIDFNGCDLRESILRALDFDDKPAPIEFTVTRQHVLYVQNGTSQRSRLRVENPGEHIFGLGISGIDIKTADGEGVLLKGKLSDDLTTPTTILVQTKEGLEPLKTTIKKGAIVRIYLDLSRESGIIYSAIQDGKMFQFSVLSRYRFNGNDNVLPQLPFESEDYELDLHNAPQLNIIWEKPQPAPAPAPGSEIQSGNGLPPVSQPGIAS